jgi:hypothetical protein
MNKPLLSLGQLEAKIEFQLGPHWRWLWQVTFTVVAHALLFLSVIAMMEAFVVLSDHVIRENKTLFARVDIQDFVGHLWPIVAAIFALSTISSLIRIFAKRG